MRRLFTLQVLFVALAGVLPAGAADFSTSPRSMEAGRKLYITKCARCHKLYNPANYSDAKWREWMDKMSKKAKLKPEQKQILSDYLETFRNGTNSAAERP
jgi:diheme cytochrome c